MATGSATTYAKQLMQSMSASPQGTAKGTHHEQKKNEQTSQTPKNEALLNHGNSGQDPRKPRRNSGNRIRPPARTRTNEQARHPKPKPYSTKATQAKTQESTGEAAGNDPGDKRERERTRTNKRHQRQDKVSRTKEKGTPKPE